MVYSPGMAAPTILIIDDDESIADLLCVALKQGGYESAAAGDGIQAMAAVRRVKPGLIILDYLFPAGGGKSVHQRLRMMAETRRTPIIVLSSKPEEEIAQNLDMDGNTFYLPKPFRRDLLLNLIGQILS